MQPILEILIKCRIKKAKRTVISNKRNGEIYICIYNTYVREEKLYILYKFMNNDESFLKNKQLIGLFHASLLYRKFVK